MNSEVTVQDGQVVTMEYTLRVDGETIDTSEGYKPIEFLQGAGSIIPGLERELYGMKVGESKEVSVQAKDGYGEIDPAAFVSVPREQFPPNIRLEVGVALSVHDNNGNPMHATIHEVNEEDVKLNFNHPLAGKDLLFSVTIAGLRQASEDELAHKHIHQDDGH